MREGERGLENGSLVNHSATKGSRLKDSFDKDRQMPKVAGLKWIANDTGPAAGLPPEKLRRLDALEIAGTSGFKFCEGWFDAESGSQAKGLDFVGNRRRMS
jgi:hypothetical protein